MASGRPVFVVKSDSDIFEVVEDVQDFLSNVRQSMCPGQ